MFEDIKGKTGLITGAGKRTGIGYGIARKLAEAGANIVLSDLGGPPQEQGFIQYGNRKGMQTIAAELADEFGVKTLFQEMDVTRADSVQACMNNIRETFGLLDFVFNNAGTVFGAAQPVHQYNEDAWIKTFDVNIHGAFRVSKAAVPLMQGRGGAIVNMASKAGKSPAPGNGAYGASKAALIMMTKVMAHELAPEGIRVNAVCPGLIKTDLQEGNIALKAHLYQTDLEEAERRLTALVPQRRMGTADEVGDLCLFLVSRRAAYLTGQAINVDGGMLMEL